MNTSYEKFKNARTFLKIDFSFLQNRIISVFNNLKNIERTISFEKNIEILKNLDNNQITDDIIQFLEDVEDFIFDFNTIWTYFYRVPVEFNDCPTITVSEEKYKVKLIEYDKIYTCDDKTFRIAALDCFEELLEILNL
jgi:hypothetical protein